MAGGRPLALPLCVGGAGTRPREGTPAQATTLGPRKDSVSDGLLPGRLAAAVRWQLGQSENRPN